MPKDDTARSERTTWIPGWMHRALRIENINEAIAFSYTEQVTWDGAVINAIGTAKSATSSTPTETGSRFYKGIDVETHSCVSCTSAKPSG